MVHIVAGAGELAKRGFGEGVGCESGAHSHWGRSVLG